MECPPPSLVLPPFIVHSDTLYLGVKYHWPVFGHDDDVEEKCEGGGVCNARGSTEIKNRLTEDPRGLGILVRPYALGTMYNKSSL